MKTNDRFNFYNRYHSIETMYRKGISEYYFNHPNLYRAVINISVEMIPDSDINRFIICEYEDENI
jgi:hypothetical protein